MRYGAIFLHRRILPYYTFDRLRNSASIFETSIVDLRKELCEGLLGERQQKKIVIHLHIKLPPTPRSGHVREVHTLLIRQSDSRLLREWCSNLLYKSSVRLKHSTRSDKHSLIT